MGYTYIDFYKSGLSSSQKNGQTFFSVQQSDAERRDYMFINFQGTINSEEFLIK